MGDAGTGAGDGVRRGLGGVAFSVSKGRGGVQRVRAVGWGQAAGGVAELAKDRLSQAWPGFDPRVQEPGGYETLYGAQTRERS